MTIVQFDSRPGPDEAEILAFMAQGARFYPNVATGLRLAEQRACYERLYLGPDGKTNRCSKFRTPLLETDFSQLLQAFPVACEWNPLRDDCFDHAAALRGGGVQAEVRHEPELVHACLRARHVSPAARAMFSAITARVAEFTA